MDIIATFFNLIGAILVIKISRWGFVSHGIACVFWIIWTTSSSDTSWFFVGTQSMFAGINLWGWIDWTKKGKLRGRYHKHRQDQETP